MMILIECYHLYDQKNKAEQRSLSFYRRQLTIFLIGKRSKNSIYIIIKYIFMAKV